jgi:hypothetical protein
LAHAHVAPVRGGATRDPRAAIVRDLDPAQDGFLVIEGSPGLIATFGHVTPAPGMAPGDTVRAGDTLATMFYAHGFDFGVNNRGMDPHEFVNSARAGAPVHAQSPIAQFPEPLRTQMIDRVQTLADPLGRLSHDVVGTASGSWFLEGTPLDQSHCVCYEGNHLFLGTLQERDDTRIMTVGQLWPGQPNVLLVIDPAAPSWTEITAAGSPIALKA